MTPKKRDKFTVSAERLEGPLGPSPNYNKRTTEDFSAFARARHRRACRAAFPRASAKLPVSPGEDRRANFAGRRDRRLFARLGAALLGNLGAAGAGREPPGREPDRRRRLCFEVGARRRHAARLRRLIVRDQPAPVQESPLQRPEGLITNDEAS